MGYWENRQAKEMYEAMESAEEAAKEIADVYAMASKELNYKIAQTYEKYRDKYNLSDEEAKKLLNAMRDPSDIEELKMKLKGLKRPEADEILKELESPAYRARIERYENLQSEIDKMMKDVYKQEKKINTNHYVDQYNDSYYREIYDLQKRTGLDFSFSNVDPKELDRILHSNWSGENYSQRIWGNTEKLAQDVKQQLTLAYLTGKNESDIAAEIARLYATGAAYARRLIRTESAYISGQAQAAADEEAGIDSYRILATLDLRTSEICREMDGKVFEYKDMQVGVNFPPFHPYCRTTVLSEIDDQDLSQLQRRSRDPETGKIKTFPGDITYKEWYEKEVAHLPKNNIKKLPKMNLNNETGNTPKSIETEPKIGYNNAKEFPLANTIEEAEELIRQYVDDKQFGALGVSYKGIGLDVANEINRTVASFYETYKVDKLGGIISPTKNSKLGNKIQGAHAGFIKVRNSLILNRDSCKSAGHLERLLLEEREAISDILKNPNKFDLDKLSSRARKVVENSKISGRGSVPETISDVINHELGHSIEQLIYNSDNYVSIASSMAAYAPKVSGYACDNMGDYIAESFCSFRKGESVIDPELAKAFKALEK